jgi:Holliday junction resolvasome RuvABC endonuclease subunit
MLKFKIEEFEKKLGSKIKRNFQSIGVDTATKTGIGIIKVNKRSVIIDWTALQFEKGNTHEIYKQMYWSFKELISADLNCCVVEDVFLGLNPSVALKLARFGGFVIANAIENQVHFETISAKSARGKLGIKTEAGKAKQSVAKWLKEKLNIVIDDNDVSDGIVLALLGIIENQDFRSQKDIKEDKKK